MKLFLKRDNSGENSRFVVYDDNGKLRYWVKGRRGTATDRMVITTVDGRPLLTLRVATFHSFSAFSVRNTQGHFVLTLTGMPAYPEFRFHGITWRVSEFSPDKDFSVIDIDNTLIMRQKSSKNKDYYELFVECEHRELFCIATAICADVINYLTLSVAAPV